MLLFRHSREGFLPIEDQVHHWRQANRKMNWGIAKEEFKRLVDRRFNTAAHNDYLCGLLLSYGFGDDGSGNADAVLSGQRTWQYTRKKWKHRTWQCQYLDFGGPDSIRRYPEAPCRPKGFYMCEICIPKKIHRSNATGLGPEGLQLLIITHPHLQRALNDRRLPCLVFADHDVAPHGFYDAVQMFCSNDILGLGIGNIDREYPLFAIPYMHFAN